jgi:hypothetical protein
VASTLSSCTSNSSVPTRTYAHTGGTSGTPLAPSSGGGFGATAANPPGALATALRPLPPHQTASQPPSAPPGGHTIDVIGRPRRRHERRCSRRKLLPERPGAQGDSATEAATCRRPAPPPTAARVPPHAAPPERRRSSSTPADATGTAAETAQVDACESGSLNPIWRAFPLT